MIELGNETWHQGAGGCGWDGWGRPGWVHQGGLEYGLFARYMFDENVCQMPAWPQYQLADKIKFSLGANYSADSSSYAELAALQGGNISYLGHANYVGPKCETNDQGTPVFDDPGVQMTLLGMEDGMRGFISQAATTRDALNTAGQTHYDLTAYEGGPSGYWTNPNNEEIDELYGKSAGYRPEAFSCLSSRRMIPVVRTMIPGTRVMTRPGPRIQRRETMTLQAAVASSLL